MKINYDKTADAVYISIKKGVIKKTAHLAHFIHADLDKNGNVLGVEILNASLKFSPTKGDSKQALTIPVSITA
jgi:uncharacterized protein YuzE